MMTQSSIVQQIRIFQGKNAFVASPDFSVLDCRFHAPFVATTTGAPSISAHDNFDGCCRPVELLRVARLKSHRVRAAVAAVALPDLRGVLAVLAAFRHEVSHDGEVATFDREAGGVNVADALPAHQVATGVLDVADVLVHHHSIVDRRPISIVVLACWACTRDGCCETRGANQAQDREESADTEHGVVYNYTENQIEMRL